MQLVRNAIQSNPEMVQDLIPAGRERLGDAQAALAHGSPTGAVYIGGYCVEMVLKHAALRTIGVASYAYVRDALAPARARLVRWLGPVDHEGYHSLEFWALLLRETFRHRRGEVPARVKNAVQTASRLHQQWQVALRYRSRMSTMQDAQEFLRQVGWFGAKADELWR